MDKRRGEERRGEERRHIWNTSKFEDEENRNKKMMGN